MSESVFFKVPWWMLAMMLVPGCASVPADLGRSDVDALLQARGQQVDAHSDALLAKLVSAPLTADSAVRIALLNNPDLQASYAQLGLGAADIYEAGRISNPVFGGAWLDPDEPGAQTMRTLGLVTSFTDLLTLPARSRLSAGDFAGLKQQIGSEVQAIAAQAESAYYEYVGARQVAALRAQIAKAGGLAAALAQRFSDAGNMTPRELAMERSAASEAKLAALHADGAAFAARTQLAALLGLSVGDGWQAPAALRMPLTEEDELSVLLDQARQSRLDLAAARTRFAVEADRVGVVNWTRWLGDLGIGYERERETDGARLAGPTVEWEIPIFNQHKDAVLRADAQLQIAHSDVQRLELAVENDVRLAHAALVNTRAIISEYLTGLIPQRIETVARAQEEVNFMLIGIFELIELKQEEYDAYQGYLEAIRDYWIARTNLALAAGAALPSAARLPEERIGVDQFLCPPAGGMDHSQHGGGMDHSGHKMMEMPDNKAKPMDHSGHKMMDMPENENEPMDHSGHKMMKMPDDKDKPMDHSGHKMMDMPDSEDEAVDHSQHDNGEMK